MHIFTKRNACGYQGAMQYVKFGMLFVPQVNKKIKLGGGGGGEYRPRSLHST